MDYWGFLETIEEKIALGRAMVRSTSYGRGGVIELVTTGSGADEKVQFKIPITNQVFDTIEKANIRVAELGLSEVFTMPAFPRAKHVASSGVMNQAEEMRRTIQASLNSLTQTQLDRLTEVGIDVSGRRNLDLSILTFKDDKLVDAVGKVRGGGDVYRGALSISDDGLRILRFDLDGQTLTSFQASVLRNMVGQAQLNPDFYANVLNPSGAFDSGNIVSKLGKVVKREKGIYAPRDIGVVGDNLLDFLRPQVDYQDVPIPVSFRVNRGMQGAGAGANVLLLDPQYELLAKFAGDPGTATSFSTVRKNVMNNFLSRNLFEQDAQVIAAKEQFYRDLDPQHYIGRTLRDYEAVEGGIGDELRGYINRFIDTAQQNPATAGRNVEDLISKRLQEFLINEFARNTSLSQDQRLLRESLIKDIFYGIEVAWDGNALLNKKNLDYYVSQLRGQRPELLRKTQDQTLTAAQRNQARAELRDIDGKIARVEQNELYQFTGRGFFTTETGELGNVKTAFSSVRFAGDLDPFAIIVTPFDFKPEAKIVKSNILALSGLGDVSERAYVDPMHAAMHANIFLDDASIENMTRLSELKLREVEDLINSNTLPENLIKGLKDTLSLDLEAIPYELRNAAQNNREYIRMLLEYLNSGHDIRNSPQVMNMLYTYVKTGAFRTKDGLIQGVSPLSRNFGATSEAVISDARIVSGRGTSNIMFEGATTAQEIVNFRVSGHRLGFAPDMVSRVRVALGGHDNDDKLRSSMRMFRDSRGNSRLGFYITRTPSGYQESVFARAIFDAESVQNLFGEDEYFVRTLDDIISSNQGTNIDNFRRVRQMIKYGARFNEQGYDQLDQLNLNQVERTIIQVYDQMRNMGMYAPNMVSADQLFMLKQYGSSPLMVDTAPGVSLLSEMRPNYKSTVANQQAMVSKIFTKSGEMELADELQQVLDENAIPDQLKNTILGLSDYEQKMRFLGREIASGNQNAPIANAILEEIFKKAQINRYGKVVTDPAEMTGFLGSYINTTMIAGHMAPDYEKLVSRIQDQNIKNYIQSNMVYDLLEYEEAIDLQTTFSGTRNLDIEGMQRLTGRTSTELNALLDRLGTVRGLGRFGADDAFTLELARRDLMRQVGRSVGFLRSVEGLDSSGFGFDKIWLENRIKGEGKTAEQATDAFEYLKGIREGMTELRRLSGGRASQESENLISTIDDIITRRSTEDAYKLLLKSFSAEGRMYKGATSHMLQNNIWDNSKRLNLSSMRQDVARVFAETNDESRRIAAEIIRRHEREFRHLEDSVSRINSFTNDQAAEYAKRSNLLGISVFRDIQNAVEVENVSFQSLVHAMEQETLGKYHRDIATLNVPFSDTAFLAEQQTKADYILAKKISRHNFFQQFDQEAANQVKSLIESRTGNNIFQYLGTMASQQAARSQLTEENLQDQAKLALRAMRDPQNTHLSGKLGTMEEAIVEVLAGARRVVDPTTASASALMFEEEARKQADIVRSILFFEDTANADAARRFATAGSATSQSAASEAVRIFANAAEGTTPSSTRTIFKRINRQQLGELFQNKLFKGTAIGLAALAVGSLAYSKIRDVTSDTVSGPPLLPGGNPYESGFVGGQNFPGYGNDTGYYQNNSNVSYKVNINGSQDAIERFNQQAGGLVNGNSTTTIYNGSPRVDRDPYVEMGKTF